MALESKLGEAERVSSLSQKFKKLKFEISWHYSKYAAAIHIGIIVGLAAAVLKLATPNAQSKVIQDFDPYNDMTAEQAVKAVQNYDGAKDYLMRHLCYTNILEPGAPFKEVHAKGKGVCRDATTAAIALLRDNYPIYDVLKMRLYSASPTGSNHAVALVEDIRTHKYGSLGINKEDCIPPQFPKTSDVFDKINSNFENEFRDYELFK